MILPAGFPTTISGKIGTAESPRITNDTMEPDVLRRVKVRRVAKPCDARSVLATMPAMAEKKTKAAGPPLPRWRITHLKGTPAKFVGFVFAPTESAALAAAIKEFKIGPALRSRIIARRDE